MKPQAAEHQVLAGGEAELGIFLLNALMARGPEVVGPVPAELLKARGMIPA